MFMLNYARNVASFTDEDLANNAFTFHQKDMVNLQATTRFGSLENWDGNIYRHLIERRENGAREQNAFSTLREHSSTSITSHK